MEKNIKPMVFLKKKSQMYKISLIALFIIIAKFSYSQDSSNTQGLFEGKVTYQYQIINPNPLLISDEEFYNSMPNRGISEVLLFIKGNKYKYEYSDHIEIYNRATNQIAFIAKNHKDSIYYAPGNVAEDSLKKTDQLTNTRTILNQSCKAIEIKAKWETKTYYYSESLLKTNPFFWKAHERDFFNTYMTKSGGYFPLLIMRKSMLGNYEMKATSFESISISEDIFTIQ